MPRANGSRRPSVTASLSVCALVAAGAGDERQWQALPVAGGVETLSAAAGLPRGLPAWRVFYEATRRVHGLWGEDAGVAEPTGAVAIAPGEPSPKGAAVVPLPLAPRLWRQLMRRSDLEDDQLALAILADRRSSLLLRGLAAFDESTLAALAADPDALTAIHRRHADVFAAFGGRFRVRGGVVVVPGGEEAAPLWEGLVGGSPRAPSRFLVALVAANGGRRALLYDAVARLDPARQRFALGMWKEAGPEREAALRDLASAFHGERAWWRREGGSFARPEADAARLLREVRLAEDGRLAPPGGRAFWEAVFEGNPPPAQAAGRKAPPTADAAWLAERVGTGGPAARRLRLEQVVFAQRVFGEAGDASGPSAILALQGLRDARAILLVLERAGARDPALFAAAVSAARRAAAVSGRGARPLHGALQGVLAVIDRARFAGTLDEDGAGRLFRSVFALDPAASGCRALAGWAETELLPELARGVYGARPPGEPETLVLRAMAGDVVDRAAGLPVFDWEGLEYRADGRRAEWSRLEKVRARQGGMDLGQALRICRSPAPAGGDDPCGEALGGALTSVVYAAHLGDPEGPALAGEDPSLRHEFGRDPWTLPEEESGPGFPWHVRGSLLALEVPLARLSLHRLAGDALPEEPPVLVAAHRRCLSLAATLANPRDLADHDRDAIAAAVEAGRRRVASLSAGGAEVEAAARDAALEPWRARALEWLLEHEPRALEGFFSLGELVDLGAPGRPSWDAWGVADEIGSGLRPRLPRALPADEASGRPPEPAVASAFVDLGLRVALHLSERRLPATLAPSVVATLLPDLLAEARPLGPDDRLALDAWVRALSRDRLDDAVAALAAGGPLQLAPGAQEAP